MDTIKQTLSEDLQTAMRQRDTVAINSIRTLRARIDNAEAPVIEELTSMRIAGGIAGASEDSRDTEAVRKELSQAEIQKIVEGEIADMEHVLEILRTSSLPDTEHLADQILVLKRYI